MQVTRFSSNTESAMTTEGHYLCFASPLTKHRVESFTSSFIPVSSSLSRRAVRAQLGLVPSVLPARWDWASLLFPSYHPARVSHHLPPTILWTLPQSPQAPRDGSGRGPGRFPDIISGVGSGWPSELELGWGREAGLHLRAAVSGRVGLRNGFLSCLWPASSGNH